MPKPSNKLTDIRKRHRLTARTRYRSAGFLASQIGYLNIENLSAIDLLEELPSQAFAPGQPISCEDVLYLIRTGWVQIRHSQYKYLVKRIGQGVLFGEMPLLGQTMLVTEAVAGSAGAILAPISIAAAENWIAAAPLSIIAAIAPRLAVVDRDFFAAQCQLNDSRIAAILLRLSNAENRIEGITQAELAVQAGMYRETVNIVLNKLKSLGFIEVRNKSITIVDIDAIVELSTL